MKDLIDYSRETGTGPMGKNFRSIYLLLDVQIKEFIAVSC